MRRRERREEFCCTSQDVNKQHSLREGEELDGICSKSRNLPNLSSFFVFAMTLEYQIKVEAASFPSYDSLFAPCLKHLLDAFVILKDRSSISQVFSFKPVTRGNWSGMNDEPTSNVARRYIHHKSEMGCISISKIRDFDCSFLGRRAAKMIDSRLTERLKLTKGK